MQENIDVWLRQFKQGNEQALAEIMMVFTPHIKACAAKYKSDYLEYDDVIQECMIALFKAILSYDNTKGVLFVTYASTCINNAAVSATRAATRQKHKLLNSAIPFIDVDNATNVVSPGPEDLIVENENYTTALKDIENRLSHLEKSVLAAFLDGKTYSQIATELNISQKTVDNALARVRAKLR